MTNSWDWVEKQNRRERLRKRWRVFGGITMLLFLLFMYGVPRIFGPTEDDQADERISDVNSAEPVIATQEPAADHPATELPPEPAEFDVAELATKPTAEIASPADAEVMDEPQAEIAQAPVVRSSSVFETLPPDPESLATAESSQTKPSAENVPPVEAEVMGEPQTAIAQAPAVRSSSVFDTLPPDPELLSAAEELKAKLKRKIKTLDGDSNRLQKYGGEKWKSIQTLAESATTADDPAVAVKNATQAIGQLDELVTDLEFAEFDDQIKNKEPRGMLTALAKFRASHSDDPRLSDLEQSLTPVSQEQWLAMAAEELKDASPDDSGFSEGWLPIASAWQLVGNDAEAREAIRQAVEALPRMTQPSRIIESVFEICQHESFDRASVQQLFDDAAKMCEQVSSPQIRSNYFANLAGLARKFGQEAQASGLFTRSVALINADELGSVWQKQSLTQEARTASWTESPETIFAICAKIEKLNYPKPLINANAYGHAAIAAARRSDKPQFHKAMLLTENALAPVRIYDFPNYLYTVRLAEANILQRRWRAAVIVANNVPDPYLRASMLFRVMKHAPQEIRGKNLPELFERFAEQRWAALACAGYAEHRVRSGDSLLSVAEWATSLPLASLRAAAFAGIARSVGAPTAVDDSYQDAPNVVPVEINDIVSVMNEAEQVAHQIQQPLEAAFVWLEIARTWNLLGKTRRYQQAIGKLDDNLFDAWADIWEQRPPVKQSYNGGYIDTSDKHRGDEKRTIERITECYLQLAKMQADLGDSPGAMESLLNCANAAGFQSSTATFNDQNFLRMNALLNRLQGATRVGPESLPLANHNSYRYSRALIAAWSKDIPTLEPLIVELVEKSQRRGNSAADRENPARAFCELAILHAERGNLESYRDARRSAQSLIARGRAGSEMKLALATSDALAGEFALAESNLVRGTLRWFGDANRPRSQLAVSLAADGQWEQAIGHARAVSASQPLYRLVAWTAIAKARLNDTSEREEELLDWASSLESQVDRAAALCGFALAVSSR